MAAACALSRGPHSEIPSARSAPGISEWGFYANISPQVASPLQVIRATISARET